MLDGGAGYGAGYGGQARCEARTLAADRSPSSQQPQVSVPLAHHHAISCLLLAAIPSVVFHPAAVVCECTLSVYLVGPHFCTDLPCMPFLWMPLLTCTHTIKSTDFQERLIVFSGEGGFQITAFAMNSSKCNPNCSMSGS